MWMRSLGVSKYIYADILSFRCFAFSCGRDIRSWFSSMQSIDNALATLCTNLGIEKECTIVSASKSARYISDLREPVLLINICLEAQEPSIREHFYYGICPCALLFQHRDNNQLICATSGIPYMEISKKQVLDKLSKSNGFVVVGNMPLHIQTVSSKEIFLRAMEWRKNGICNPDNITQLRVGHFVKIQSRSAQLAVQYGLMNYQIQLSKVVRFCAQELKISECIIKNLNHILIRIPQVSKSCAYEDIVQIENDFWMSIQKIEEELLCSSQDGRMMN